MAKTYTEAEVAALLAQARVNRTPVTVRLNPKGTISVTGLGRWPVSLYKSQWAVILDAATVAKIRTAMEHAPDKPIGDAS